MSIWIGRVPATAAATAALLLLAGCGADTARGGCDTQSDNGVCIEYEGARDVVDVYKTNCAPGTWSDSGCPTTGRVGGCRLKDAALKLTYVQWGYSPTFDKAMLMQSCAGGTFVP